MPGAASPTERGAEGFAESGRDALLVAAASCFMDRGFAATSIDDVADRLGATKGKVYHYFRSKTDLFFAVHRRGMAINLEAIRPIASLDTAPRERLGAMCRRHVANMIDFIGFQRVVMQGVEMHLAGATTPGQREELALLMREREEYEALFRAVLEEGREKGEFSFAVTSFASKAVLAVLNNPVIWYRPEKGLEARERVIEEFTRHAIACVTSRKREEA